MVIMIALEVNNIINTMQILERRNEKFVHWMLYKYFLSVDHQCFNTITLGLIIINVTMIMLLPLALLFAMDIEL